jgi:uncharacterized damage-inducible protein DinB
MNQHLTTAQLLDVMRNARSNWEALLAEVGEARLTEPGVEGHWSLKDIIAHITYYEVETADWLSAIQQGETPRQSEYEGLEQDERNARLYERIRTKSLVNVLRESSASFQHSLDVVQGLHDEDLYDLEFTRKYGVDWTIFDLIKGDTFEHYQDHSASVRAWLDRVATHQA